LLEIKFCLADFVHLTKTSSKYSGSQWQFLSNSMSSSSK